MRLFEDFLDDTNIQAPDTVSALNDDDYGLGCLTFELSINHAARENFDTLGRALSNFAHKLRTLGQHVPLLDDIERIEFGDKEHNYAQEDSSVVYYNAGEFRISSRKKDLTAEECQLLNCDVYFRYDQETLNARQAVKFYKAFDKILSFCGSTYVPKNRMYIVKNCRPVPDDKINPEVNINSRNQQYADLFFDQGPHDDMYLPELFYIMCVLKSGYEYGDFLKELKTDGLEEILRNYYFCGQFSYGRTMELSVRKVGYFEKTGDAALPEYIKDKHPVAGSTEMFMPFGNYDYGTSQPWSPTLRNVDLREYCNSHGCNVYMLRNVPDRPDMVICIYDGTYITDEEKEYQIVTETTGKEMGIISKELALSCFMPYEKAQGLCDEFFGREDEYDEDE